MTIFGQFNAQSSYEVGVDGSVTYTLSDPGDLVSITEVRWVLTGTAGVNVTGHIENQQGAFNHIDFYSNISLTTFNNGSNNKLDFQFGDIAGFQESIEITVVYTDTIGNPDKIIQAQQWLNVNVISPPTISGPSDLQECCVEPITYSVSGYQNANIFDWSITGGTILLDNGTSIVMQPSLTSPISIDCNVSRQESVPAYNYSNSKNTTRSQVVTPPIQGVDYLCIGEVYNFFLNLDGFCGDIEDVVWDIPQDFEVQSIEGEVITIAPTQSMLYQSFDIKARLIMAGGCIATTAIHNVTIFQNGTPPTPQGYIAVTSDPTPLDPCKDYFLFFDFVQTDGFQNAIITISPKVFIGVPHHRRADTINVRVCYYNPCSDIQTCTTFVVDLPEPCPYPRIVNLPVTIASQNHEVTDNLEKTIAKIQDIQVFPNPTTGILHIKHLDEGVSRIRVMDMSGKIVVEKRKTQTTEIFDLQHLVQGLYVVEIFLNDETIRKLIVVE